MKKLSTSEILGIAITTVATAAVVAGVVIVAKKCKKAIDVYEQEMLDAENAEEETEVEETAQVCPCTAEAPACEETCEAPCACQAQPEEEAGAEETAEEEITE